MSAEQPTIGKIPIVDMGQLSVGAADSPEPEEKEWRRVAGELKSAFTQVGFVYIANHGIPNTQIQEGFANSLKFFSQEKGIKLKYIYNKTDGVQQGYVAVNREQLDDTCTTKILELRESYYLKEMDGMFPDKEIPEMRPAINTLHNSCRTLTVRLLTAMALALELDRDFFTSNHKGLFSGEGNSTCLRLNYYPPVPASIPENCIRCSAHTDYGSITLLFQDSMGGLQVHDIGGSWVEADPTPGTILVNIGDILQLWTAGKFIATMHRVIIPRDELQLRIYRQSIAFFVSPDDAVLISSLDNSSSYQPVRVLDYLNKRLRATYRY